MEGDWGCGGGGKVRVAIKCRWDSRQILGRKGTWVGNHGKTVHRLLRASGIRVNILTVIPGPCFMWDANVGRGTCGKESTCQGRRCAFNCWEGKIPWRRKWQPTLGNPMEKGAWGLQSMGHKQSDTTEQLNIWGRAYGNSLHLLFLETFWSLKWFQNEKMVKKILIWDFPGSSVVKDSELPMHGVQVRSLDGELRSHVRCNTVKKKN